MAEEEPRPAAGGRWGKEQKQCLLDRFESGKVDPQRTDAAYINAFHDQEVEKDSILGRFDAGQKFRDHYKNVATAFMANKALSGVRKAGERTPLF
jgi:hypothetical protein